MVSDINEQAQAEEALRRSEERYRQLFDRIMDGMYRCTEAGRFVEVNAALARMLGYDSEEELLRADVRGEFHVVPAETGDHLAGAKQQQVRVYQMRRRDGTPLWVEDHGSSFGNETDGSRYREGVLRDITERRRTEEELQHAKELLERAHRRTQLSLVVQQRLARTDSLTGLCNRRHFFEQAAREFRSALRYRRPLAILMFDVDNLKRINDTHGHTAGDKMLVMIAQIASAQVRAVDILARHGGDEFVILLPQTGADQALLLAERIREGVAAQTVEIEQSPVTATLSVGVAELTPGSPEDSVDKLTHRADLALYASKSGGRNRTTVWSSTWGAEGADARPQ